MTDQIYAGRATHAAPSFGPPPSPPPQTTFFGALRRYPMVVLFFLVLLAAAGVTYGIKRPPVYTATTELNVGTPNGDSQATPGYVLAAVQLASSYSREATSQVVTNIAGRPLHLDVEQTSSRLSSSAVPESPTLYVHATGPSSAAAIELVNRATDILTAKVNAGVQSQSAGSLLSRYNTLQAQANQLASNAGSLAAKFQQQSITTTTSSLGGTATTAANSAATTTKITSAQVKAAKLQSQTAELKAQSASERYTTAEANGPSANLVVLFRARTATDDHVTVTERYGLVGAIAGIVLGAALAFLLARWRDRRRGLTV